MSDTIVTLGDVIYPTLLENSFLRSLYEDLLFNYAINTLSLTNIEPKVLDIDSLLCFADLLSKSTDKELRSRHQNIAQEIASLLSELYADNPNVQYYLGSTLSSVGNYRGVDLKANSFKNLIPEENYGQQLEMNYLAVPKITGKYFFPEQKRVYDALDAETCSFSAPTSLGKTFVITSFITARIADGTVSNYAIVLPTKALISEVSYTLGKLLHEVTSKAKYRILSNAVPSEMDKVCSYIAIMTPEQLHHTICSNPNFHIDWLFIDEAYKISLKNNKRSGYYLDLIDELQYRGEHPHIVFASPGVPNPGLYLKLAQNRNPNERKELSLTFSPVSQIKFMFDETTGEVFVYNSIKNEPFLVCKEKQLSYFGLISIMQEKGKKSIVYCGSKKVVEKSAIEFMEFSKKPYDSSLEQLSGQLKSKIHSDFWLADTVQKGIGYHMGYLPASVRNAIESSFRDTNGGLDVVFCTSTLLEGVNLPADNIFITSTTNGGEMTSLDFRNLMGRVGRIEYNLHGNVFLVHRKKSKTSLDSFKNLLEKPIEIQEFSFVDALDHETKGRIVENLKNGNASTPKITDEEDSRSLLERSLSNKLLKDIIMGKTGVLRDTFSDVLTKEDAESIETSFADRGPVPDDIFISMDQSKSILERIKAGLCYPPENATWREIQTFLETLKVAFNWVHYDPDSLGKGKQINHYAVLISNWINGADLSNLIAQEISGYETYMKDTDPSYDINNHKDAINRCISKVLEEVDYVIGYKLCRYFQQFSQTFEFYTGKKPTPDWHEFLEYGFRFPTHIWLCKQGFTREAAKLIAKRDHIYIDKSDTQWKLQWDVLSASEEELIRDESARVILMQGNTL